MKQLTAAIFAATLLWSIAPSSIAATLAVDTGIPVAANPAQPLIGALSLDGNNWLAGQVTFTQAVRIYSINYWLNDNGSGGGTYTVALYDDSANLPGSLLTSATGAYAAADSGVSGWHGISNLFWEVNPGTYWTALEIGTNDSFSGVAPISAPFPLAHYAFNDGSGYAVTSKAIGVQVAVPEPPTVWLLIPALVVLGRLSRHHPNRPIH